MKCTKKERRYKAIYLALTRHGMNKESAIKFMLDSMKFARQKRTLRQIIRDC